MFEATWWLAFGETLPRTVLRMRLAGWRWRGIAEHLERASHGLVAIPSETLRLWYGQPAHRKLRNAISHQKENR